MVDISHLPLREELRGQRAYGAPQLDVPVALNTNENPYPPSPALVQSLLAEIQRLATRLNRYPDRDAVQLRADLADYVTRRTGVEVTGENVWAANGSNEILQQLLQAFGGPGRSVLGFQPSYSMHPILAAGTHTEFLNVPRRADFTVDIDAALAAIAEHQPSVLFITTPNNPTGTPTGLNEIEQLCRAMHAVDGIVIVDEAYAEFSESPSATTLIAKYPATLVVSRTMSKAFDFAGVRLGYFVADPAFVEAVQLVRLPYHLSVLTQAAARAALRHADETLADVDKLIAGRHQVVAELQELGYTVMPSESNFVFFGDFADQHDIWQQFLDRGVLIRDVGVAGYLRATIGTPEENEAFVQAAREVQR
ncbi:histidinol-phosphate transaminase [Corynebacterium propinquum]|uniref:histidinol-phosphate transaminase n=1 Tax=Corynebacterium propinquum TaxID=43769 RepID=UPI000F877974|nr:histidinol-phosphate transaminase [Corynebacterium propinquum]MDK4257247.1 histidinol-phosphate transaminase [Corynebacterium propinquum]MDK4282433.1 histidinol-phosphate transaminase [Corynebacterium propinquum]MDK4298443.1 histidinol-phosphate transaminase [Corynebacterium propinquum]RUP80250.1 histidinol-phosphate transaminase [Corynebacterium propinquum]RUP90478.1 histidinol-phosphate transaminase [Corynebacterium propinquum]